RFTAAGEEGEFPTARTQWRQLPITVVVSPAVETCAGRDDEAFVGNEDAVGKGRAGTFAATGAEKRCGLAAEKAYLVGCPADRTALGTENEGLGAAKRR